MFGMGSQELLLILVIVLVLFGGSKLPDLAKSPQACGYCKNPLEADWAHCPRCGTPVVPRPTPTVPT